MLKRKSRTSGRKYPRRKTWIAQRDQAFARADRTCEISGEALGKTIPARTYPPRDAFWKWERAADHLWPERFIRHFLKGANPHIAENIFVITPRLHARKTPCEARLYKGDFLGYYQDLRRLGWDQIQIDAALKALTASIKNEKVSVNESTGN